MNAKIVEILRISINDPALLYAAQRIEELEAATAHLERLDAASQRALALRENRVRDECLVIAMNTLRWYASDEIIYRRAKGALMQIEQRLAELEPEDKAE